VAFEVLALDPLERVGEIDVAGARLQMDLVAITKTIGQAHLLDPAHVDSLDKAGDPFRHEVAWLTVNDSLNASELMASK